MKNLIKTFDLLSLISALGLVTINLIQGENYQAWMWGIVTIWILRVIGVTYFSQDK